MNKSCIQCDFLSIAASWATTLAWFDKENLKSRSITSFFFSWAFNLHPLTKTLRLKALQKLLLVDLESRLHSVKWLVSKVKNELSCSTGSTVFLLQDECRWEQRAVPEESETWGEFPPPVNNVQCRLSQMNVWFKRATLCANVAKVQLTCQWLESALNWQGCVLGNCAWECVITPRCGGLRRLDPEGRWWQLICRKPRQCITR